MKKYQIAWQKVSYGQRLAITDTEGATVYHLGAVWNSKFIRGARGAKFLAEKANVPTRSLDSAKAAEEAAVVETLQEQQEAWQYLAGSALGHVAMLQQARNLLTKQTS